MPDLNFQQLFHQLQTQEKPSQKHSELLDAIRAYDTQTASFRQPGRNRKLPLVTAKDKDRLLLLHQQIAAKADELLADQEEPEELREIVRKITVLASGSYNALLQYDPGKGPRTLSTLEEDVRTLTLHQGNVLLGGVSALSGSQSQRMPLSFLDGKGKQISGVFTKKTVLDPEPMFRDAFKPFFEAGALAPEGEASALRYLRDHFTEQADKVPGLMQNLFRDKPGPGDYLLGLIVRTVRQKENQDLYLDAAALKNICGAVLEQGNCQAADISEKSWQQLAKNLEPMIMPMMLAHKQVKIPLKARIDSRSAAMSAVADLLGMSRVIARAKPMRIVDPEGNVIDGTFMEAGKGMDINNLPPEAEELGLHSIINTNGQGFKDIANIQILDYLCGSPDRNSSNIFYQFDKNGKFCGAQIIDNDTSLGCLDQTELGDVNSNYRYMTNLGNLKAIPKDTYRKILTLDASTLKYALRGYGLSEPELKAAGMRLEAMQNYFRQTARYAQDRNTDKSKLPFKVLSDSDFKNRPVTSFYAGKYDFLKRTGNTFSLAAAAIATIPNSLQDQKKHFQDLTRSVNMDLGNRARRPVVGMELQRGTALQTMLRKRTWWGFSSGNYELMQQAVENYVRVHKSLETRLDRANDEEIRRRADYRGEKEAVVSEADLELMKSAAEQMREAARRYLLGKMPEFQEEQDLRRTVYPQGASNYTKRRIDTAKEVLKAALKTCKIQQVERQTAQANLEEARAAQRRHQTERNPHLIAEERGVQPGAQIQTS